MSAADQLSLDMRHALLMVSRALDFIGQDELFHGHRVAYIAYETASLLGWSQDKIQKSYYAGLLHDCGVTSSQEHFNMLRRLQPEGVEAHCIRGYNALRICPVLSQFANIIRYHHMPWQDLQKVDISDDDKDLAGLIYLADRVEFFRSRFASEYDEEFLSENAIVVTENLMAQSGTLFNPVMTSAMEKLVTKKGFWRSMEPTFIENLGLNFRGLSWYDSQLSLDDVEQIAGFLANIVDAKSPFTFMHSAKVAELSQMIAFAMGVSLSESQMLYIAGLLHDLGKLKTPDFLLNYPGQLTDAEHAVIRQQTVETGKMLKQFFKDSPIGLWATEHNEKPDGSGFPESKKGSDIDLPTRILAAADIFQALSQKRPYRGNLSVSEILSIMGRMANSNQIDEQVYQEISKNVDQYYEISTNINTGDIPDIPGAEVSDELHQDPEILTSRFSEARNLG